MRELDKSPNLRELYDAFLGSSEGMNLLSSLRGIELESFKERRTIKFDPYSEQEGVGGRWSFGPHSRVGRGVGINFSRQRRIVRFT